MTRVRLAQLVLALALVLGVLPVAHAQRLRAVPDEDVTVLTAQPPLTSTVPAPDLAAPPDLTGLAGLPLVAVDVVVDDDHWPDVRPPAIAEMRPGDRVTAVLIRKAIREALASGHFADAHVELARDGAGVRATIHVMPRK